MLRLGRAAERSLEPRNASQLVSATCASHLDAPAASSGAAPWIRGNIHFPVDFRVGETRVLSNPRGDPEERGAGFVPDLEV